MPQENVDLARRAIEATLHTPKPDVATMNELFHPEHEFISLIDALEGDRHVGGRGYRDWLVAVGEVVAWESSLEAIREVDDERVVAVMRMRAEGVSSGVPLREQPHACVMTIRDSKVVRTVVYPSPEDALKAVGLAE
jgi:ketosteroid isomerase-like protein